MSAAYESTLQMQRMISRLESIAAFCDELNVGACTKEELMAFIADLATSLSATLAIPGPESGQIPVLAPGYWAHDKLY